MTKINQQLRLLATAFAFGGLLFACSSDPGANQEEATSNNPNPDVDMRSGMDSDRDQAQEEAELTPQSFVSSFRTLYDERACRYVYDCPELAHNAFYNAGKFEDRDSCLENYRHYNFAFAPIKLGIDETRTSFDPQEARQCLSDYEALSDQVVCSLSASEVLPLFGMPTSCGRVFSGLRSLEESCANNFECGEGLHCSLAGGECEGICVNEGHTACGDTICSPNQGCINAVCTNLATEGDECDGNSTSANSPCASGLYCNQTRSGRRCIQKHSQTQGEACSGDRACARGFHCDFEQRVCVLESPYEVSSLGDPCSYTLGAVNYPERCGPNLACTERVQMGTGSFEYRGTCNAVLSVGDPCQDSSQCGPNLFCLGEFNVGEDGVCTKSKSDGTRCSKDNECESNTCMAERCSGTAVCLD